MSGCSFHPEIKFLLGKTGFIQFVLHLEISPQTAGGNEGTSHFWSVRVTDVFLITKEEDICGSRSFFGSFLYVTSKWGSSEGRCRFILCFAAIRHSFCALPAVVELLHCRYPKTHCATLPAARCSHISLSALRAWHSGESRDGCVRGRGSK